MRIILLLVSVAYTCCGDVRNDDDIKVRIRVKGKPESKGAYYSNLLGENLKLICELISANHSATDDRLEWTKLGRLRTNNEDFRVTDGSDYNVITPIDAIQKGNSSVVTFKSLSEDDSGTYRCTSRKYGKIALILIVGAKPIKVDLSNMFRSSLAEICKGKMHCKHIPCVSRDDCGSSSPLCCPEDNKHIRNQINYESSHYQSPNYGYLFVLALVACVVFAIRYCLPALIVRMATSSNRAPLLIQRTIVIQGPVGDDDVERGGANNEGEPNNPVQPIRDGVGYEGVPLHRGGASGEGEEPSNGLPAYSDAIATQAPPPSYADAVANLV